MELNDQKPFISFVNAAIRLRERVMFENSSWQIRSNEHWAILGPNGSGKSTLVRTLWGATPLRSGTIVFHYADQHVQTHPSSQKDSIGYVSFELHQRLMEYETWQEDLREFAGKEDGATTAQEVILSGVSEERAFRAVGKGRLLEITDQLGIRHLLERGISFLSTGEMRKVLIARAMMKSPRLLILDEPFDGLDAVSRDSLSRAINGLMTGAMRVILITHRIEEIISNITSVLLVKDGGIFLKGAKEEMLTSENMSKLFGSKLHVTKSDGYFVVSPGVEQRDRVVTIPLDADFPKHMPDLLINMKDVQVKYDGVFALRKLSWSMKRGENWAILGPNGSGKSTILRLILGDNPQAYANEITIFGKRKGSGETFWEIKKNIGVVSSEFQIQYRKKLSAFDVIVSGFFDSVGLYRYPTAQQRSVVDQWIRLLDIREIADEQFDRLSYGQRRMILLARAMVKSPLLLILDEPCHGLDILNRKRILKIIEGIGQTRTHLLYVTHRKEEILNCITHVMCLQGGRVLHQARKEEVLRGENAVALLSGRPDERVKETLYR